MSSHSRPERGILLALLLVALNLRPALASLGPVLESVRSALQLPFSAAGLLTSLPVICMGLFAPLTVPLSMRFGLRNAILGATLLIGCATLLRAQPSLSAQFASTLLIGAGIAVLGPLLNMYIKQSFATHSARISSWATSALCLGAALAAGSSATLSDYLGWSCALSSWAVLAFVAGWYWQRRIPTPAKIQARQTTSLPWRELRAWQLLLTFGLHGLVFYSLLAWLAPAYISYGMSATQAGQLLGVFTLLQILGTLLVSLLPVDQLDRRPALLAGAASTLAGLLGTWLAPLAAPFIWMTLLGAGTAGLFALTLILPLDFSDNAESAGSWTAMMSSGGYVIAAMGPYASGLLRDLSGSYTQVFAALCIISSCVLLLCLLLAPIRSSSVTDHAF